MTSENELAVALANLPPTSTRLRTFVAGPPGVATPLEVLYMEVTDDPVGGKPFALVFSAPVEYNFNTATDPKRVQVLAFVYANWILQNVRDATVMFKEADLPTRMKRFAPGETTITILVDDLVLGRPRLFSDPFEDENRAAASAQALASMDPCPVVGFNRLCDVQTDCTKNSDPEKMKEGPNQTQPPRQFSRWGKLFIGTGLGILLAKLLIFGAGVLLTGWVLINILCALNICACPCNGISGPAQGVIEGSIQKVPDCATSPCCPCEKGVCKPGSSGVAGRIFLIRGCNCDVQCIDTCRGDMCEVTKGRPPPAETAGAALVIGIAIAAAAIGIGAAVALSRRRPEEKRPPPPAAPPPASPPSPSLPARAGQATGRAVGSARRGISEFVTGAKEGARRFP